MAGVVKDPTVCDTEQLKSIEQYAGVSLKDADPSAIKFIVDQSKRAGNDAFKQKKYKDAVTMYSQAIAGNDKDHTLYSNRSAAYLALGLYDQAVWDAQKAVKLQPDWPKAHYRLGAAHFALSRWQEAVTCFQRVLNLEQGNTDASQKLAEAQERLEEEENARKSIRSAELRSVALKLRAARREDQKQAMLNQIKQSMVGPDWELDDLDWRPTFLPRMKLQPLDATSIKSDPKKQLLLNYIDSLADLANPKLALATLADNARLNTYTNAISTALNLNSSTLKQDSTPNQQHALVLSSGGGILGLLTAKAGADKVTCIEHSRMLYRMAKQILDSNKHTPEASKINLVNRGLQAVSVVGEDLPPEIAAILAAKQQKQALSPNSPLITSENPNRASNTTLAAKEASSSTSVQVGGEEIGVRLKEKASLLVTDLVDHTVLGMGLLPAIDHASTHLLTPNAIIVPQKIKICAMLVELRVGNVSGFDLSALDVYRWYPTAEKVFLNQVPHRQLSGVQEVFMFDLQARVADVQRLHALEKAKSSEMNKNDESRSSASEDGEGIDPSIATQEESNGGDKDRIWENDVDIEFQITQEGNWNAIAFWFELGMNEKQGDGGEEDKELCRSFVTSYRPPNTADDTVPEAASFGQAIQYTDGLKVKKGSTVKLRLAHDQGQLIFITDPPQCRPRHALVPRWHYDMVLDHQRNEAYDKAIRHAVKAKNERGIRDVVALDMGAGSGLLSLMTARAGASSVYAGEVNGHMCDVGEECTILNGFLGKITMLDRDVRRMDTRRKPDGTPPDMPSRADLAVYEVFDSGLIGEGVLHILAAASQKLLLPTATLVPCSATVYCQPIEMRLDSFNGFDLQQANRWRWRPDYEGLELAKCRDTWRPLGDPVKVFEFDFYEVERNMQPSQAMLELNFTEDGVFNAVAMWFVLDLDEETSLSTSPYIDKGPTWQQAVQWMPEIKVVSGDSRSLVAKHDTYSISFAHSSSTASIDTDTTNNSSIKLPEEPKDDTTGVPLYDPVWKAAFDSLQALNSQLVKACVQNPLEYRAVAQSAVRIAARPHDLGVDARQAAEFCTKMMG